MQTILHLTDIHFGWEGKNAYESAQRKLCLGGLLDELKELRYPWRPTVVCLTGDIGWRGAASDYIEAKKWLDALLDTCGLSYERLLLCPGNHDIIRDYAKKVARPQTAAEADVVLEPPISAHLEQIFQGYIEFRKSARIPDLAFGVGTSHLIGERTIDEVRFVSLNSAWYCKDNEDKGKLWIGQPHMRLMEAHDQFPVVCNDPLGLLTVCLVHHPPEWLRTEEIHSDGKRSNTIDYLAQRCNLLLTGHTHGEVRQPDRIADGALHFTGGSAFAGASHFNSFRLIQLSDLEITDRAFEFDPTATSGNWKSLEAKSRPLGHQKFTHAPTSTAEPGFPISKLRQACVRLITRHLEFKSRLLRPKGDLPVLVERPVSLRVSVQRDQYDNEGRLVRSKTSEHTVPFYEAARSARRIMLFGDLGSGKSTLLGKLAAETLARSERTVAILIPVKSLNLNGHFSQRGLLDAIDQYVSGALWLHPPKFEIQRLLESRIEVLLLFDGLDEISRELGVRLLANAATLPETWPTIQVAAAARPVEMAGVSFEDWRIVHTVPLNDVAKRAFFQAELLADGFPQNRVDNRASELVSLLNGFPALAYVANSPLAVRLMYPRLNSPHFDTSLTLGDLLYELLLERLGGWQQRDDKPDTYTHLSEVLPSAEAKAEFLAILAERAALGKPTTQDEAKELLRQKARSIPGANEYRLADEAYSFFEWLGLISISDTVAFPLQPLAETSAAAGLLQRWQSKHEIASDCQGSLWRVVSFAAALARRRGCLENIRRLLSDYMAFLLQSEGYVAAACYIVVEAKDPDLAQRTIDLIDAVGFRPLTGFYDERQVSERNIARTLFLAGDKGLLWFYKDYLDPCYPIPLAGSAILCGVFAEWANLVRSALTELQRQLLAKLIAPYTATAEANFSGVLSTLVVMVPEAFSREEKLWNLSRALDNPLFSEFVLDQFRSAWRDQTSRQLVEAIVLHRAGENLEAARLWLEWNSTGYLPSPLVRLAFRVSAKGNLSSAEADFVQKCHFRVGDRVWMQFARWAAAAEDSTIAAGAAKVLFEAGERRLSILGNVAMKAAQEGNYAPEAEKLLSTLVQHAGNPGIRWLAVRIANSQEWGGAHSGWWRVLLAHIAKLEDGPALLARCVRNLGPFTIPRYPEIREALTRLLTGEDGKPFREALRRTLRSLDPKSRRGAAIILITADPRGQAEALFFAIRSRANSMHSAWHEWESFCLTLEFGPSALAFLNSKLEELEPHSRAFALMILKKAGIKIEDDYCSELTRTLSSLHCWHLSREPAGRVVFEEELSYARLIELIQRPSSDLAEPAAERLLELHRTKLSPEEEAVCIALRDGKKSSHWNLAESMRRVLTDPQFAENILKASSRIMAVGGAIPLLGLFAKAIKREVDWKDFIWTIFCSDSQPTGLDCEGPGMAFLEISFDIHTDRELISKTALECLEDPRMQKQQKYDAYQWLALISDEFDKLDDQTLRKVILHGKPIRCAATTALIARLGEVPSAFKNASNDNRRPTSVSQSTRPDETATKRLLTLLNDYARDSHELHPNVVSLIRELVFLPPLDERQLDSISIEGRPGALICLALRFIYGWPTRMRDTIPLLDFHSKLWSEDDQSSDFRVLRGLWQMMRESSVIDDPVAREAYLSALHEALLSGGVWKVAIALEILELGGGLKDEQIPIVFAEITSHSTWLHARLVTRLSEWLSSGLKQETIAIAVSSAESAIVSLNESQWIPESRDWDHPNLWADLFFPAVLWVHSTKPSDATTPVFLRGLRTLFTQLPTESDSHLTLMSAFRRLDSLLAKAQPELLRLAIQCGAESLEPSVAVFCRLIRTYSQRALSAASA